MQIVSVYAGEKKQPWSLNSYSCFMKKLTLGDLFTDFCLGRLGETQLLSVAKRIFFLWSLIVASSPPFQENIVSSAKSLLTLDWCDL